MVSNISNKSIIQLGVDRTMDLLLFDDRVIDPETLFVINEFKLNEKETILLVKMKLIIQFLIYFM